MLLCKTRRSHLCVGLDPDPQRLPDLPSGSEACFLASKAVAEASGAYVAAFKPNAAFFESADSAHGMQAVGRMLQEQDPMTLRICDAKRGDIGNTSSRYAAAILQTWNYDAITVNPLMGSDSVEPFLQTPEKGVFLLCLTSNPGAADFLLRNDLYKRIAEQAVKWNMNGNVGLVVGATRAEHAAAVREIAPELPFLVPGVGAQGGSLSEILDAIDACNNPRFLINASRSIMYPEIKEGVNFAAAAGGVAKALRDSINELLE